MGLTPATASAAPPEPEPGPVEPALDPPTVELEPRPPSPEPERPASLKITTSAVSIVLRAEPLDRAQAVIELGVPPVVGAPLSPGRYRVTAEGPGYRPWSREVELIAGETLNLQVEPELIEGARLELRATDEASVGAAVSLDGALLCVLPCSEELEPGAHQLEVRKRRSKGLSFGVEVAQADEIVIDLTLAPATSRAPAIVTGAIALSSLTAAIVFTVRSDQTRRSLASDLQSYGQYDRDDRRIDNGRRDAVIGGVMYGVTAAVGALTLYYLLRQSGPPSSADKRRRSLAWQLAPSLGPTGGGLVGVVEF
ncbi:PEGA domain-containing protein [Enhygromyxa salina]|uniref:PEGA domain-containing protein n=1 Tax=Enhygromyxa salina TaxID=215803 RepID=UPI0011B26C49|nr:PEGA domain-containing protein [Enhygromyxa salina]